MDSKEYNRSLLLNGTLRKDQVDYLLDLGTRTFQEKHPPLVVDGFAGPNTRAALDQVLQPARMAKGLGYVPRGKGLYVMDLDKVGSPDNLLKMCEVCGFSFVCILSVWQQRRLGVGPVKSGRANSSTDLILYSEALRKHGIEVWVWGYPHPAAIDDFVSSMVDDALRASAVGVIVDPEKPFKGQAVRANVLVDAMLAACKRHDLAAGVTSYAATWIHKDFPYEIFSHLGWGSPQVYDAQNTMPFTYGTRAVAAYKTAGWKDVVISVAAFNKTPKQLHDLLMNCPPDVPALIFWDYNNLCLSKNKPLWEVIREHTV